MTPADDRPTPVPLGEPDDAPDSEVDGDPLPIHPEIERYHIGCAWHTVTHANDDDPFEGCPMVAKLFAAVCCPYEGAEDDPPIAGVLQAIRDTLKGWAHAKGESTLFAAVPFPDLVLLMRRIDVALALARRDADRVKLMQAGAR